VHLEDQRSRRISSGAQISIVRGESRVATLSRRKKNFPRDVWIAIEYAKLAFLAKLFLSFPLVCFAVKGDILENVFVYLVLFTTDWEPRQLRLRLHWSQGRRLGRRGFDRELLRVQNARGHQVVVKVIMWLIKAMKYLIHASVPCTFGLCPTEACRKRASRPLSWKVILPPAIPLIK